MLADLHLQQRQLRVPARADQLQRSLQEPAQRHAELRQMRKCMPSRPHLPGRELHMPATQTDCSGLCKNLNTDPQNCGGCNRVCPAGQPCCSGACKDVTSDPLNCGRCANECPTSCSGIRRCVNGTCQTPTQSWVVVGLVPYMRTVKTTSPDLGRRPERADKSNVLATRAHAPDRCHLLGGAGSVKVVFACTFTRQVHGCGCPAATDGLDGFCPALDNSAAGAWTPRG